MPELTATRILMKCAGYVLLILMVKPLAAQTSVMPMPLPSTQDIVDRMMARNAWQDEKLLEFRSSRKFYAVNIRFKTDSTMYVQTVFRHSAVLCDPRQSGIRHRDLIASACCRRDLALLSGRREPGHHACPR